MYIGTYQWTRWTFVVMLLHSDTPIHDYSLFTSKTTILFLYFPYFLLLIDLFSSRGHNAEISDGIQQLVKYNAKLDRSMDRRHFTRIENMTFA